MPGALRPFDRLRTSFQVTLSKKHIISLGHDQVSFVYTGARTRHGRMLGPGLAQVPGGGLCGYAADLEVDLMSQHVLAHHPVLDDAARQVVAILAAPAVVVVDTGALPAAFIEPWRSGSVEDSSLSWPARAQVSRGRVARGCADDHERAGDRGGGAGATRRRRLCFSRQAGGGAGRRHPGDLGALDVDWITEDQLVGLTGASVAPKLYLALGIDGDTSQFMATQEAGLIVAVQPNSAAPFVPVADYNIIAEPAEFAGALLKELTRG